MRLAYVGLDLLLPALTTLLDEDVEIMRVFTCRVDNVYEFNTETVRTAIEHNIPYTFDRITRSDIEALIKNGCDGLICGGYYYKLPVVPELIMINIHPALLPIGRGSWPMPVTILRGLTESGVTLHKITDAFDEGDIIMKRSFSVSPREDLESLTEKFRVLLPEMMRTLVADIRGLWNNAVPQTEGEYWRCPDDDDATVDSTMSEEECDRILRAFYGFECYLTVGNKKYSVYRGRYSLLPSENSVAACDGYINAERINRIL